MATSKQRRRLRTLQRHAAFARAIITGLNVTRDVWLDAGLSLGKRVCAAIGLESEARK